VKNPNPKIQIPNKSKAPNSKSGGFSTVAELEFGIWSLFGIWDLDFGISRGGAR
jgi:hypothetical protein